MALPTIVSVQVKEDQGDDNKTSVFQLKLDSGENTLALMLAAVQPMVEGAAKLMTGTVESVNLTIPVSTTGWTLTNADGVETDRLVKGRFIFTDSDGRFTEVNLPTFDLDLAGTDGNSINSSDVDVAAFIAAALANSLATAADGDVVSYDKGYITYGGKK